MAHWRILALVILYVVFLVWFVLGPFVIDGIAKCRLLVRSLCVYSRVLAVRHACKASQDEAVPGSLLCDRQRPARI